MALSITFYNDIKYTKDDFMNRDRDFFGNGVVKASDFPLTFPSTPNMTFQVGAGVAWVDGYRIANDANQLTLTVPAATSQPRIDIVQIGHDDFHSYASLVVKQGIPGASPIEPGADPGYLKLYAIHFDANVTAIANAEVNDRRALVPLNVSGTQISYVGAATTGANTFSGNQTAPQFVSNASSGTPPLVVASSTKINGLNSDLLDGLHADDVVGQRIQFSNLTEDQYYFIGTLPASSAGTSDKLYIKMQGGPLWDSSALTFDWVMMGNHDRTNDTSSKFAYQYMRQGIDLDNSRANLRVVAFKQTDGSVQVYLRAVANTYATCLVEATGISLYNQTNTALPIGEPTTTVPTGILVFDSGDSTSYPPNAHLNAGVITSAKNVLDDGNGNLTIAGMITSSGNRVLFNGADESNNLWFGTGRTVEPADIGFGWMTDGNGNITQLILKHKVVTDYNTLDNGSGQADFSIQSTGPYGVTIHNPNRATITLAPSANTGNWNSIVQDADQVLMFAGAGGQSSASALSIVPWSTTKAGLRLTNTGSVMTANNTLDDGQGNMSCNAGMTAKNYIGTTGKSNPTSFTPDSQGIYFGWNYQTNTGEGDIFVYGQEGAGGLHVYNTTHAVNGVWSKIFAVNSAGVAYAGSSAQYPLVQALAGGYKLQSGILAAASSGVYNVTFPVAFAAVPVVVPAYFSNGYNVTAAITVQSVSTTSVSFYVGYNYSGASVHWYAIGN